MRSLYYICAQPATYYYSWQVDAMLLSFKKNGNVELNRVHVVSSIPRTGAGADEHFLKVANIAVQKKVDIWITVYQSSGIDVHTGVTGLAGMTKSVIAMNEIKKNN